MIDCVVDLPDLLPVWCFYCRIFHFRNLPIKSDHLPDHGLDRVVSGYLLPVLEVRDIDGDIFKERATEVPVTTREWWQGLFDQEPDQSRVEKPEQVQ